MIIKCTSNSVSSLPDKFMDPAWGYGENTRFHVTVGNQYRVYTVSFWDALVFYYIADDCFTEYPRRYPASLFKIIDNSLSKYWGIQEYANHKDYKLLISFNEWLTDPYYFEKLLEGDRDRVRAFYDRKRLIDSE